MSRVGTSEAAESGAGQCLVLANGLPLQSRVPKRAHVLSIASGSHAIGVTFWWQLKCRIFSPIDPPVVTSVFQRSSVVYIAQCV